MNYRVRCLVLSLLVFSLLLLSCGQRGLPVASRDFKLDTLVPGPLTQSQLDTATDPEHPDYEAYACAVRVVEGMLCVDRPTPPPTSHCLPLNDGYFLGVNLGEFEGRVDFYPYHSNATETVEQARSVISENCLGMIKRSLDSAYIITFTPATVTGAGGSGSVWRADRTAAGDPLWSWKRVAAYDGQIYAYFYDEDRQILYLTASGALLSYTEDSGLQIIQKDTALLSKLHFLSSIAYLDNTLYCGSGAGVYALELATGKEVFYPLQASLR